jgi:hypothetical protein
MLRARSALFLASLAASMAVGCGRDFFGAPKRPGTDGFRAHATVKKRGKVVGEFDWAVRGNQRRKEAGSLVTLWDGDAKTSTLLDTAARTARQRPFVALDEALPGHPMTTGFSEKEEAARRGIETYHRESDAVLAGHVCWIWRFEDRPEDPTSPSTTYWIAPDLDRLVLRVERETPGGGEPDSTELKNMRIGAGPELFRVPEDFRSERP